MAVRLSNRPNTLNIFMKYNRIPIFLINRDRTPSVKPNIQTWLATWRSDQTGG